MAISCLDPLVKHRIATAILNKFGGEFTEEYLNAIRPLMAIPECPTGFVGFGTVKERKRKKKLTPEQELRRLLRRPGITCLCEEAKKELEKLDERVKEIPTCDTIGFAEVEGERKKTPYQEFMSKCMKELKDLPVKERMKVCAQKWKEMKKD